MCFSDVWSVSGHLNCLDNKLAINDPICQICWIFGVGLVILWPHVYFQVVGMKISQDISILLFMAFFSVCTLFATSFWQCPLDKQMLTGVWGSSLFRKRAGCICKVFQKTSSLLCFSIIIKASDNYTEKSYFD